MKISTAILLVATGITAYAQTHTTVTVDAASNTGIIEPLWGDHYEMHLLFGWGGNPFLLGSHQQFIDDSAFLPEMSKIKPRYVRVSSGRFENPPDITYFSESTTTLRNLWTEFYKGPNTLAGAHDLSYYDFSYVDSLADVVFAMGAKPFFDLAYMPFSLSSDTTPDYNALLPGLYLLAWDNSIRNSPPSDLQVYSKVMYQLIKHLNQNKGVEYFELWNEPDQFWWNPFFWKGSSQQLYDMYRAVVNEIQADTLLSGNIKIGCCGFALNSALNLFPKNFLNSVQTNNTRMDFISFHPYSDSLELGGYDSSRVDIVTQWRDTYVPGAELINSEWGILDTSFGSAGWSDLDYGLERTRAIADMNNRDIKMAHQATLADIETTSRTCCMGMYYVDPVFSPKPSAYVYANLNKLLSTPVKLEVSAQPGNSFVLAGKSHSGDTIVVAYPAYNPPGIDTVSINITNLPWSGGAASRYELTETSFDNQIIFNKTDSFSISSATFQDSLFYGTDQKSGRLIIWELAKSISSGMAEAVNIPDFRIYPNPSTGEVYINARTSVSNFTVTAYDMFGRIIFTKHFKNSGEDERFPVNVTGLVLVVLSHNGQAVIKKIYNFRQ